MNWGNFKVDTSGNLDATNANFTGSIRSGSSINVTTQGGGYLTAGVNTTHVNVSGLNVGNYGINMGGHGISECNGISTPNGTTLSIGGSINILGGISVSGSSGKSPTLGSVVGKLVVSSTYIEWQTIDLSFSHGLLTGYTNWSEVHHVDI